MSFRLRVIVPSVLVLATWLSVPPSAQAATADIITVTTSHDELNSDGDCSLREAVQAANTDSSVDQCSAGSGGDTIAFDPSTNGQPFDLTMGSIDISSNMTIDGNGNANTVVTGDEFDTVAGTSTIQDMTLVLVNNENATVTVANVFASDEMNNNSTGTETSTMTITDSTLGDVTSNSGFGTSTTNLTIIDSGVGFIDNNSGFGTTTHLTLSGVTSSGGIGNNSSSDSLTTADITDTTVTGSGSSDGIDMTGDGTTGSITGSTVTGFDEGIFVDGGHTTIVNSTISGNGGESIAVGGGTVDITNSTITNAGTTGIDSFGGVVTVTNTIISNHPEEGNCNGPVASGGGNIADDGSCNLSGPGDQENTDPQIGPLADNGGPTETHLPQTGSPAIDGGLDAPCPSTDQRGDSRPQDGDGDGTAVCDVGSVEVGGTSQEALADLSITKTDSPDPVLVDGELTYTLVIENHGPDGATNLTMEDTLPPEVTFERVVTTLGNCRESAGIVTCDMDALGDGGQVTVTIVVTANQEGTITNRAFVLSSTHDPDDSNDTAEITTTVNSAPTGGVGTGAGGTARPPLGPVIVVGLLLGTAGILSLRRRRRA